ncbi:MAG: Fe-S cluster assembly protein SufD [Polyangiales bacterium]
MTQAPQKLLESIPTVFDTGPAWLRSIRTRAADTLRDLGLPTKKTEAWRFTPVRSFVERSFVLEPSSAPRLLSEVPEGVTVRSLREVLDKEPHLLEGRLGQYDAEHFAALNTALFEDGLWVHIHANAVIETPLELQHQFPSGEGPRVDYPRLLVTADRGSQATLIESYRGGVPDAMTNSLVEIDIGTNAIVDHVRVHENRGLQVGKVDVRQDADSRYRSVVVTLGGALLRCDVRARLQGRGAECQLDGAYLVDGADHVDHHTLVEHEAPHCRSAQTYRGIANDRGTAVFDGIVVVHRDAQKTEAHQENRNLLLSEAATVHTKPHLEIDADDVVCSHGATVGALDSDQMFYLRARGVPEELARAMLIYAFIEEIVDEVRHSSTRDRLREAVLARIPQGESLRGVT